jgi:hypothetical protein
MAHSQTSKEYSADLEWSCCKCWCNWCAHAEKLRGVFEALLADDSSRLLMRKLLAGAGMEFDEEAFEEQVKLHMHAA